MLHIRLQGFIQVVLLTILLCLIGLFLATILGSHKVSAVATYDDVYVRKDGHDTNCNGNVDAPASSAPNCAHLTTASAHTIVNPGGNIHIGGGTYNESVTITVSGVTIQPTGGGSVLFGPSSGAAFNFSANNITIDGIDIDGTNFVITGNPNIANFVGNGVYIPTGITGSVLKNMEIYNSQYGIQTQSELDADNLDIHDNGSGVITSTTDLSTVHVNYSKIYSNISYGVVVGGGSNQVDAEYNYWGDATGPYHDTDNSNGNGDSVGVTVVGPPVDVLPWYATSTTNSSNQDDYIVSSGATIVAHSDDVDAALAIIDANPTYTLSGSMVENDGVTSGTMSAGTDTIDAKATTGLEVTKTGSGTPNVTLVKFSGNPFGTEPGFSTFPGSYVDVHLDDLTGVDEITIKIWYTDAQIAGLEEDTLTFKYWNGSSWVDASNTGVNTTDVGDYSGYIWVTINSSTTPDLSYLTGQQFSVGGTSSTLALTGGNFNGVMILGLFFVLTPVVVVFARKKFNII